MVTHMFQIPRLDKTADSTIVVTRWGRIDGVLLRVGDRLVLGPPVGDSLMVLLPRGYGRPMLGRRGPNGLVAEPSGVPVSSQRWRVAGAVTAVERDLERGGVGAGECHVACRVEGHDIATLARARSLFNDGALSERDLIHLCSRAAVAPEELNIRVAISAAADPAAAEALLVEVPAGAIRLALPVQRSEVQTHGMVVPGPWQPPLPSSPAQLTFEELYDIPVQQSRAATEDEPQQSLFGGRETA